MLSDNQETVEILIKSRMDIKEFESNLGTLQRKISSTQKELETSLEKLSYAETKNARTMGEANRARIEELKRIELANRQSIATYKTQETNLIKQIALTKELGREQAKAQLHANAMGATKGGAQPFKMGSESTSSMNAAYASLETAGKGTNTTSFLQRLLGQHDELDKKIKQVDATAKNSFPHKVSTTAQYMAAGAGIAGIVSALGGMGTAIIESDKAMGMFESVLSLSVEKAKALQQEVFNTGKIYGGTISDLNETTLALGRAGIKGDDLVKSMKAVSQIALLSGEDLATVTDVFVSWKTVFPTASLDDLADSMVGVANATKIGISDIKTASNYLLTSGKQAGLTTDALLALSGAWAQIGKSSSTIGTEGRRFFEQITAGSNEVKKAYKAAGINVDELTKRLAKGGPEAEQAMRDMFSVLNKLSNTESQKILKSIGATLDRATFQSLLEMSKSGADGVTLYAKILESAGVKANGIAKAQAERVALTYEKMWERIKNSMTAGSSAFENSFKEAIAGPNATLASFNEKLESADKTFNTFMSNLGSVLGTVVQYIDEATIAYVAFKTVMISGAALEAVMKLGAGLKSAKDVQLAFNLAVKANPWVLLASVIAATTLALYAFSNAQDEVLAKAAKKSGEAGVIDFKKSLKGQSRDQQEESIFNRSQEINKQTLAMNRLLYHSSVQLSDVAKEKLRAKIASNNEEQKTTKLLLENTRLAKKMEDTTKRVTTADTTGLGKGSPELKPDKGAASRLEAINKNLLDQEIQKIQYAEQEYFYKKNITSELEQQKYHLGTTLEAELKATKEAGYYKNQKEDTLKLEVDIWKNKRAIKDTEYQSSLEVSRRLEDTQAEYRTVGYLAEEKLIELNYSKQLTAIEREITDIVYKKGQLSKEDNDYIDTKVKLTTAQTEKLREQAEINRRLRTESIAMTSLQIQSAKATSGYEQIAFEKEMLRTKFANDKLAIEEKYKTIKDDGGKQQEEEIKNARELLDIELRKVQGAEDYLDLLNKSNIAYQRNNSTAQQYMRITELGLSTLSSGLSEYFNIGNAGYAQWSTLRDSLEKAIMKGLMDELVVANLVAIARMGLSSAGSFLSTALQIGAGYFTGSAGGGTTTTGAANTSGAIMVAAKGAAFSGTHFAKGGDFTNKIVKEPTHFSYGGGFGTMGEAGPEAIMPLRRTATGEMGIITSGGNSGGTQQVTVHIVNESGEELKVTKSEAKTDMSGMVLDIVIDAIARNKKGMRDMLRV